MVARYSVCHSPSNLYTSHIRRVCNVGIPHSHAFSTGDYAMTAAEREWLQEEANSVLCDALDGPPAPRFDWRLRATSRQPIPAREPDSRGSHRHYIKRMKPPHTDALNGEPFFDEIQVYQARFLSLLVAEQAEDEAVLKDRLSSWTLGRLMEEGYCLTGLAAYWLQANQFGRPVAAFLLGPGLVLPEHRFDNGTQVLISRLDPLQEQPVQGNVVGRTTTQLKISFQEAFDLEGPWRLDVGHSNIVYRRMRTAISYLSHDPVAQESSPQFPDRQLILQGTHLRDVLLRTFCLSSSSTPSDTPPRTMPKPTNGNCEGAFMDDARIMSWARRYRELEPIRIDGDPVLGGLNVTQIRAIAMMIGERMSLLQGPPGTGKTKTIIETIKLLKVHFEVPHPILVCTYTNIAVDNLVEGLALSGIKPLRVGFSGKVKSSLVEHTLDHKLEKHVLKPELDKLAKKEQGLQNRIESLKKKLEESRKCHSENPPSSERLQMMSITAEREHEAVKARMYALHQQMLRDVVAKADVICTTCITSACVALNVIDFPVVFLDEASMSTEPASLIPIMKGSRHVALIGDHKQLPPVIASREAQAKGLGISLFERLIGEGVVPSIMLDVQYRMHPAISRFPSSEFYNFTLQDGTVDSVGKITSRLLPPTSRHLHMNSRTGKYPSVVFLDHAGSESRKDRSKMNMNEAHIVCSVVEDLLLSNEELRGQDIGIISPFVAQVSVLIRLLNTDGKYRKRFKSVLGEHRAMQLANMEIKTVDGFEGREKDVIIFSTVCNNANGHIGFLADRRRLNVGLTRAKRGLFVVGSIDTLMGGRNKGKSSKGAGSWRRYAQFLSDEGLVIKLCGGKVVEGGGYVTLNEFAKQRSVKPRVVTM